MKRIGTITIGQTPRPDITADLRQLIPDIEIVETGALDGLDHAQIRELAPGAGHYPLVTLLRDGTSVDVGKELLYPFIEKEIRRIALSVDAILLLCSGPFPDFAARVPILYPSRLLDHFVRSIAPRSATILVPHEGQVKSSVEHWGAFIPVLQTAVRSPYPFDSAGLSGELIIMDCLGYSLRMKEEVRQRTRGRAILVRSVAASVIRELVS